MKTVSALHKGLGILRLLNEEGISQIRQLHEATAMPKPTIVRMLETLAEAGYVTRNAEGGYRVTAQVLALSAGYDFNADLLRAARPVLDKLREENAWPADLAIFDRDAMVIMNTGTNPGTLSANRRVGTRLPATVTALGRAYLAFLPEDELIRLLAQLEKKGDAAARKPDQFLRQMALARRRGYAICNQELARTTRAVAVPVLVDGLPVATFNMMAVANALSMEKAEALFAPVLKRAARRIADALSAPGK
jgi:IclR family mhp operon transcriptional activator